MTRGNEILQRAMDILGVEHEVIGDYAELHRSLIYYPEALTYLLGSLERYIQAERLTILGARWSAITPTPEDAREVEVNPETMRRLNGIVGFYGVNRVFLFLYLHAHLYSLNGSHAPYERLNEMIEELDPR